MNREQEVEGIIVALDALLTAIREDNKKHAGDYHAPSTISPSDWTFEETELELAADQIIRNPVGRALRNALTLLGQRLHEMGGMDAMHEALDRACKLTPEEDSWREGILDRNWNGIGSWLT